MIFHSYVKLPEGILLLPYIGKNNPNWRSHIFQRGGSTTNQFVVCSSWFISQRWWFSIACEWKCLTCRLFADDLWGIYLFKMEGYFFGELFFCFGQLFWISVSLLLCFSALAFPCFFASIVLCFSAAPLFCFFASSLLCFSTVLPLCFSAFPCFLLLSPAFPCFSLLFCFSSFSACLLSAFPYFFAYLLFCFSAFFFSSLYCK